MPEIWLGWFLGWFSADSKIAGKQLVILQGLITFPVLSRLPEIGKKCKEYRGSYNVPK